MNKPILLVVVALTLGSTACPKGGDDESGPAADKKAHEAAINDVREPVALISAYQPFTRYPEDKDKYSPKRKPDLERSTACAANEIRFAANKARQKLETSSS